MERVSKKIVCFSIIALLISSNFMIAKAEALPEVMSGSSTLADCIMSYFAMSGSAIANTDWINALYTAYGSNFGTIEQLANQGYLVLNDSGMWEPIQQLGEMIEESPAYASLGLNEMFSVSQAEVEAGGGLAVASGGTILAGSLGGVASVGVLPLFGGVTASYWGGIALGTLIAHKLGLYGKSIDTGTPITMREAISSIPTGYGMCYRTNGSKNVYYSNGKMYFLCYPMPQIREDYVNCFAYVYNTSISNGSSTTYYDRNLSSGSISSYNTDSFYNGYARAFSAGVYRNTYKFGNFMLFPDSASLNQYVDGLYSGTNHLPSVKSPDMIGENGNLEGEYEDGKYTVPDMKPQIDPGQQAGKPLSLQDWQNFANGINSNNNQTSPTGSPDNKSLFNNILGLIRAAIPDNAPGVNPNPYPDPDSPPVVTPVPDPSYPDPVPDQPPQESENPQETEPLNPVDTGKPWMLPDLTKKFPFCIPWDIADCFGRLKTNVRQAPHIQWRFNPPNTPVDYTFNLDLEDFEEAATLLRTLELIGFIVGLAFTTRYLIGAS